MKTEIVALWKLIDLLRQIVIELLNGLKKPAEADANKFPPETRSLFHKLASLLTDTCNLHYPADIDRAPAEYRQVVVGLAEAVGFQNPISQMRGEDAARWLRKFCMDITDLGVGMHNHRDGIKRIMRICRALEGECLMVCNTPPEKSAPAREAEEAPRIPSPLHHVEGIPHG